MYEHTKLYICTNNFYLMYKVVNKSVDEVDGDFFMCQLVDAQKQDSDPIEKRLHKTEVDFIETFYALVKQFHIVPFTADLLLDKNRSVCRSQTKSIEKWLIRIHCRT